MIMSNVISFKLIPILVYVFVEIVDPEKLIVNKTVLRCSWILLSLSLLSAMGEDCA